MPLIPLLSNAYDKVEEYLPGHARLSPSQQSCKSWMPTGTTGSAADPPARTDSSEVGWLPVGLRLRDFPRYKTFSAKTRKVPNKPRGFHYPVPSKNLPRWRGPVPSSPCLSWHPQGLRGSVSQNTPISWGAAFGEAQMWWHL